MDDPDRYLDLALDRADPDSNEPIVVTAADLWQDWWSEQAVRVGDAWPALRGFALTQGFVVTSRQLAGAGVPRHVTRRLVAAGVWSAPQPGVVGLIDTGHAAAADRFETARRGHAIRAAAAALVNAAHAVSGASAAVLHGLPTLGSLSDVSLTVSSRPNVRRGARAATLDAADRATWFGVPVTSVARTCVDLARHDRKAGLVAADAALHYGLVTAAELGAALTRARQWPGVARAREVVAFADGRTESPLESLTRLALHDAGFPPPQPQFVIPVPGRRNPFRVDFCWPDRRLVLEADGRTKYLADENWRQNKREAALRRLGYRVERVTWFDIERDWASTCAHLWAALAG